MIMIMTMMAMMMMMMMTLALLVDQVRLEERLACPEPLSAHLGGEY